MFYIPSLLGSYSSSKTSSQICKLPFKFIIHSRKVYSHNFYIYLQIFFIFSKDFCALDGNFTDWKNTYEELLDSKSLEFLIIAVMNCPQFLLFTFRLIVIGRSIYIFNKYFFQQLENFSMIQL